MYSLKINCKQCPDAPLIEDPNKAGNTIRSESEQVVGDIAIDVGNEWQFTKNFSIDKISI